MAALYVHLPFCARKCRYCDFVSYAGREEVIDAYLGALIDEMGERSGNFPPLSSIFIGGGTPSLLAGAQIGRLFRAIGDIFAVEADAEITVEANPGTLSVEKLAAYRAAGVNRLSLGAQSFDDGLLKTLGRVHGAAQIGAAVRLARAAGFGNISLDLMYALPGQTLGDWGETLKQAADLDVAHISAYGLIVEAGTPMCADIEAGRLCLIDEDMYAEMQLLAVEFLAKRGYARYEISNYARPGFACRHNIVYWTRGDYLGVGCAAHSFVNGVRTANTAELNDYLSGAREVSREVVDENAAREERLMLETRLTRGLRLRDFPFDLSCARPLIEGGLLEVADGYLRATTKGFLVHNALVDKLLEGL